MAENAAPSRIGDYRILDRLGQGGMAVVYLAESPTGDRVALKLIRAEYAARTTFLARFGREWKTTARLDHPGVVAILDGGVHDDSPFYVMEYLPFPTLEEVLERDGQVPEATVLAWTGTVLGAMAYYAARGVVHRDLKPSNIVLRDGSSPVLMDFGLVHDESMTELTATGEIFGTPAYMSPEMLEGERVDIRADLYQWGVIIFECLAGTRPFPGQIPAAVASNILRGGALPLVSRCPGIRPGTATFVANLMARDRGARYPDPDAALADLERARRGGRVELRVPDSPVVEGLKRRPGRVTRPDPSREPPAPPAAMGDSTVPVAAMPGPRGRRLLPLAAGLLALAAVLGLGGAALLRTPPPVPRALVVEGFRRVAVTWDSPVPLRTALVVAGRDGAPVHRAEDDSPATTHRFLVDRATLPEGPAAASLVVLPDGPSSLPRPLERRIPAVEVATIVADEAGLALMLRSSIPMPSTADMLLTVTDRSGRSRTAPLPSSPGTTLAAFVPDAPPDVASVTLTVVVTSTDESETLSLDDAFRAWANAVAAPCARLEPETVAGSIVGPVLAEVVNDTGRDRGLFDPDGTLRANRVRDLPADERDALVRHLEELHASARRTAWGTALLTAAPSQDVILSSPLVPLQQRREFFRRMIILNVLEHVFLVRGWPSFTGGLRPFGPRWKGGWGEGDEGPPATGWKVLADLSPATPIKLGGLDLAPLFVDKEASTRKLPLPVPAGAFAGLDRVAVWVDTPDLPEKVYLNVDFGPVDFSAFRYVDGTLYKPWKRHWYRQILEPELFASGVETVTLEASLLGGFFRERSPVIVRRLLILGR